MISPMAVNVSHNSQTELVTVIMPAKNSAKTIRESIQSVLNQTYGNLELIVVDNGSSDNTVDIVKELQGEDERIFLTFCQVEGAAAARNEGIVMAKGRYIAFLDSDDAWDKSKLEKHLAFMQDNKAGFSFTSYYVNLSTEAKDVKLFKPRYNIATYKKLLRCNDIGCSTVICDQSIVGKPFMNLKATKREDYACWLEITKKGTTGLLFEEPLTTYRISKHSVSYNKVAMLKYQWNVCHNIEKHNALFSAWLMLSHIWNRVFKGY